MSSRSHALSAFRKTFCVRAGRTFLVQCPGMTRSRKDTPSATALRSAFAARLVALRLSYAQSSGNPSMSASEFARLLDVGSETYRKYERGETEPPLIVLTRIHSLTGVSLDHLIAGDIPRAA